jgi:protein phosphatase
MVRSENQDAFAVDDHAGVWVVADGMGGHAGGRIASQLAVRSILDHVQSWEPLPSGTGDRETIVALLVKAVSAGCRAIVERTTLEPELQGMGTTVVGVAACRGGEPAAAVAHVGDSRAYLIRSGQIRPLTVDHSMVEQLVRAGQITREEARRHPQQNVLLKALGLGYDSLPDTQIVPLQTEDLLLLCTDGITKTLLDHEILSIVMESADEPREACQRLIDLANARGGSDNATVLLISFRKRI